MEIVDQQENKFFGIKELKVKEIEVIEIKGNIITLTILY